MKTLTVTTLAFATILSSVVLIGNTASAAEQCGAKLSVIGVGAVGGLRGARERRAKRRANRAWRRVIEGYNTDGAYANHPSFGLGTTYSDIDNSSTKPTYTCKGYPLRCTVTATPCIY